MRMQKASPNWSLLYLLNTFTYDTDIFEPVLKFDSNHFWKIFEVFEEEGERGREDRERGREERESDERREEMREKGRARGASGSEREREERGREREKRAGERGREEREIPTSTISSIFSSHSGHRWEIGVPVSNLLGIVVLVGAMPPQILTGPEVWGSKLVMSSGWCPVREGKAQKVHQVSPSSAY